MVIFGNFGYYPYWITMFEHIIDVLQETTL